METVVITVTRAWRLLLLQWHVHGDSCYYSDTCMETVVITVTRAWRLLLLQWHVHGDLLLQWHVLLLLQWHVHGDLLLQWHVHGNCSYYSDTCMETCYYSDTCMETVVITLTRAWRLLLLQWHVHGDLLLQWHLQGDCCSHSRLWDVSEGPDRRYFLRTPGVTSGDLECHLMALFKNRSDVQ